MAPRNRQRNAPQADHDAKRQKIEPTKDFYESCLRAINSLNKLRRKNYDIANDFLELPSKKLYPNYYVEIKSPISIKEIKEKLSSKVYSSAADFVDDFKLMRDNAIQFNGESSELADNATVIVDHISSQIQDLKSTSTKAQTPLPKIKLKFGAKGKETPDLKSELLSIIDSLISYEDNGVAIAEPFLDEVSKKDYPDYYQLIKQAMSLNSIKKNINSNKYSNIDDFKKHLELVWSNAKLYNDKGSLIYQDAETLEKFANGKINSLNGHTSTQTPSKAKKQNTPDVTEKEENEENSDGSDEDEDENEDSEGSDEDNEDEDEDDDQSGDEDESDDGSNPDKEEIPFTTITEPSTYLNLIKDKTSKDVKNLIEPTNAFIEEITISSSRSIYRQIVRNTSISSTTPPAFQNWFEYKIQALQEFQKSHPRSYSINLPSSAAGSISLAVGLNNSLIKRKHNSSLSVNGERVNPQPSIHYPDTGRPLTSRFELKIPSGLNKIQFNVTTESGGVDSLATNGNYKQERDRYKSGEEESIIFWVHVS